MVRVLVGRDAECAVLSRALAAARGRRAPVVLVSGEEELPRAAATLGVAVYIPKPVNSPSLLRAVHALCEGDLAS